MRCRLGTIGFGYAEWASAFYPPGMRPGEYLGHYARRFDTVELDTTFHAMPDAGRVRRWAAVTPPDFRFCVKAPRAVTHDTPIERAAQQMKPFTDVVREFGDKLGVILLQFPPSFTAAGFNAFASFLQTLPKDLRFAVEFRHDSWQTARAEELLRECRVCFVAADYQTKPHPLRMTSDFLYVRLIGVHGQFHGLNREEIDVSERLEWWKEQFERQSNRIDTVWSFFGNDYAGYAIRTCERFRSMLGLMPIDRSDSPPGTLFD
jgi:uncharacterized protein YecE (DUF72 family)